MSYALLGVAEVAGVPFGAARWRRGQVVDIGVDPELPVPVPAGSPRLGQVRWLGPDSVSVVSWKGERSVLKPDGEVRLTVGDVAVTLSLAPAFPVRRGEPFGWAASLGWFATVLGLTLLGAQGDLVWRHRCLVAPAVFGAPALTWYPECLPGAESADPTFDAELLQRLLNKDFEGEDVGTIAKDFERPEAERTVRIYMPGGHDGPKETMGGAAETSDAPSLLPEEHLRQRPAIDPVLREVPNGRGVAVSSPNPDDVAADDETEREAPSAERVGWGIADWYDEEDERLDSLEIKMKVREAKARLRLDPDDEYALSLLSYYQYLSMDYLAAEATYDRSIELYPADGGNYNNKALIYKRKGLYVEEEGLYLLALALRPDDVTALNNLAVNLAHQGRIAEALEIMARLEVLDPDDAYADLHRAKIHAMAGNEAEAMRYMEKSLLGMEELDTLHTIEYRQDIRLDPAFAALRKQESFHRLLHRYYGKRSPLGPAVGGP